MAENLPIIKSDMASMPASHFVTKWIFDSIPYVFQGRETEYIAWRESLATQLHVDPSDIIITGSAALGYSLTPEKNFKAFDDRSDIDISIVSSYYFSTAWNELLQLKSLPRDAKMRCAVDDHRKRLIFWGTIATDKILPLLSFGINWDKIITKEKNTPALENHEINFLIYRDRIAIRQYICVGIERCKATLIEEAQND